MLRRGFWHKTRRLEERGGAAHITCPPLLTGDMAWYIVLFRSELVLNLDVTKFNVLMRTGPLYPPCLMFPACSQKVVCYKC